MVELPVADELWLARARVPAAFLRAPVAGAARDGEGCVLVDVRLSRGRIADIAAPGARTGGDAAVADLGGRQLWPTLVDVHTHIDKSQVIGRIGSLGGSFAKAREAINADRVRHWNRDDIRARMEFCLRCAYAHGVGAIRSHIDSYEGQAQPSWEVFAELKERWRGRVELQATSSVPIDVYTTGYGRYLADLAAATPGGLLGGVLRRSTDHFASYIAEIDDLLDAAFTLAKERGLSIDLHVDETLKGEDTHLDRVAAATLRHGLEGRVVCGHCCSLSVLPDARVDEILRLCAQAGVAIVTLPTTNLYMHDRAAGRTPRRRGATVAHEIRAHGIPLAVASDNVRDAFYPFGDYDMVDTLRQAVGILHLDQDLDGAFDMVGPAPAKMMGAETAGTAGTLTLGAAANAVVFDARSVNEILCRPQIERAVLNAGKRVREALPAYAELDPGPQP